MLITVVAGCIAREMGLPIHMVCAVTNDAMYRAVYNNDYSVTDLVVSLAPAINIQVGQLHHAIIS